MTKRKNEEERKPDLNEADNQAEIEARIREMMELDEARPVSKPISVTMDKDEQTVSAPELPNAKKPVSIKIVDHNDVQEAIPTPPVAIEPIEAETALPQEDPDVLAAIEEANKQLLGEEEPDQLTDAPIAIDDAEPEDIVEPPMDTDEVIKTAPEIEETPLVEEASVIEGDGEPDTKSLEELWQEGLEESEDQDADESEQEPIAPVSAPTQQIEKVKPLRHLDSIIPKTKVTETLESRSTDKAVEEIIAKEADDLLRAEDEKLATAVLPSLKAEPAKKRTSIFKRKLFRRTLLILVLAGLGYAAATPNTRYYLLNTAGVRSQASVTVLDASTQQPLKDVLVKIGQIQQKTGQDGRAEFNKVELGPTEITIEKRAFAAVSRDHVIGWGSNPLADVSLAPTGSQYEFIMTDFLSGKPIAKVEATSNEAAAISNDEGKIKLTIDQQDNTARDITISGENYRIEKFPLNLDQKEPLALKLVPERKHVFISNRSGRFDVYKVDIDGKNEKLVLPGTGSEREDMVLVPHPTDEAAALISTKDNKRNKDGFLLSTLTVMNLNDEVSKSVVTSERVQVIDWIGSRIVYVQIKEGASGDSPDRHKLMSYEYKTGEFKELAASNYFNDVSVANGQIYVAPSSTYSQNAGSSLIRINADGTSRQTIINKEVWNIFRTNYGRLTFAVGQDWYELKLGENQAGKLSGEPPSQISRVYSDSPDKKRSLWAETRDGKGVLLAYNTESKQDETIRTQGGLKLPVRWLTNRTLVYRISTESESADYALNLDGGEPVKIRDVTNTSGVNIWYYY